jgi:hypothetical protein
MEHDFSFQRNCEDFSKKIKEILSVPRYERTIDGSAFLQEQFKLYKELISGNAMIEKFKGDLTLEAEDMEAFVTDHWNIIFRPTLRRFKKKNMELIECVKKGGQSVTDIIEPPPKPLAAWTWLKEKWAPINPNEKEEDIESVKEKPVDFNDVYTVKEMPPVIATPKKILHVAFTEQVI